MITWKTRWYAFLYRARRQLWNLRIFFKRLLGDKVTEWCHRCGKRVEFYWWTSDKKWKSAQEIGLKYDGRKFDILCMRCFEELQFMHPKCYGVRWIPQLYLGSISLPLRRGEDFH